jgi:3-deoxy-D-manno-octulosonic-acid transferase
LESELEKERPKLWFHCSSLGEYEQGLPVFEAIMKDHPKHQVVLSFFSPSGYEIKKDRSVGDVVVYLPLDTMRKAARFVDLVDPKLVVFTKYDIWPNFLNTLKNRGVKTYLISALFRPGQVYFQSYGGFMRRALESFEHIFTQDEASKSLLESIGFVNASVSGDTRFDRVSAQLIMDNSVDFLQKFTQDHLTIVFGSSWPEDDELFIPFINTYDSPNLKYLIAPHKISRKYTNSLTKNIQKKVISYTELQNKTNTELAEAEVFILDTIGYLSKAYHYGDIAYVGGAAGHTGLHNILEPAVFSLPILIGKNFAKFPEAKALLDLGGLISVKNQRELHLYLSGLVEDEKERLRRGAVSGGFIKRNTGAVSHIMEYLRSTS